MAVPAGFAFACLGHHKVDASRFHKLLIELGVATDAVVHDDFGTHVFGHNGLTLAMRHEIGRVLQSVHCLEAIFGRKAGVGHMAIVARGVTSMTGVAPSGIVRGHDMAVDTGRRVIAQVSVSS